MFRMQKRRTKHMQEFKSSNCNKPDREIQWGPRRCGTSDGFWRAGMNQLQLDAEDNAVVLGHPPDPRVQPTYWNERHDGQTMEGALHDRTKWPSSKDKTRARRALRIDKEQEQ